MHRKFVFLSSIAAATLLVWLYWSTTNEMHQTLLFLNQNHNFRRKTILEPVNTTCQNAPFIIIIVTSYIGHVELRSAHRRAMDTDHLKQFNAQRVFLLAKIPNREKYITQEAIEDENRSFGDLLQGSFEEHYRNLTYKHLMGLDWASTKCHKAKYILKVDDDTVFNLEATYKYLTKLKPQNNLLIGYMLNNTIPKRLKQNKWFVTAEEYPRSLYPPYLSGWYYITTPYIAAKLVDEAIYHSYFWIDDIFITGILTEAMKIKLRQLPIDFWLEYYELLECCLRDMITKGIKCDHVVGPNGGRNNLIYEFNEAIGNCDKKICTKRSFEKPLKKMCVAFKDRTIFSDGHPEVENIKL